MFISFTTRKIIFTVYLVKKVFLSKSLGFGTELKNAKEWGIVTFTTGNQCISFMNVSLTPDLGANSFFLWLI